MRPSIERVTSYDIKNIQKANDKQTEECKTEHEIRSIHMQKSQPQVKGLVIEPQSIRNIASTRLVVSLGNSGRVT